MKWLKIRSCFDYLLSPFRWKKMCIQHVKILQGKRPVFLVSSWHSLEHEMPSRSQWFGPLYKPPACYSELYSVCPRGQLRRVCSQPAADVGGETQKAKNNRRAYREGREKRNKRWNDFLHSSCLRLRRIMVCECVHQDGTLGRHRISESLENNKTSRNRRCNNLNIGVQQGADKKKRLILPPNACFITKFMMMACNSLPSFSERCYIQLLRKSRSPL